MKYERYGVGIDEKSLDLAVGVDSEPRGFFWDVQVYRMHHLMAIDRRERERNISIRVPLNDRGRV